MSDWLTDEYSQWMASVLEKIEPNWLSLIRLAFSFLLWHIYNGNIDQMERFGTLENTGTPGRCNSVHCLSVLSIVTSQPCKSLTSDFMYCYELPVWENQFFAVMVLVFAQAAGHYGDYPETLSNSCFCINMFQVYMVSLNTCFIEERYF